MPNGRLCNAFVLFSLNPKWGSTLPMSVFSNVEPHSGFRRRPLFYFPGFHPGLLTINPFRGCANVTLNWNRCYLSSQAVRRRDMPVSKLLLAIYKSINGNILKSPRFVVFSTSNMGSIKPIMGRPKYITSTPNKKLRAPRVNFLTNISSAKNKAQNKNINHPYNPTPSLLKIRWLFTCQNIINKGRTSYKCCLTKVPTWYWAGI